MNENSKYYVNGNEPLNKLFNITENLKNMLTSEMISKIDSHGLWILNLKDEKDADDISQSINVFITSISYLNLFSTRFIDEIKQCLINGLEYQITKLKNNQI